MALSSYVRRIRSHVAMSALVCGGSSLASRGNLSQSKRSRSAAMRRAIAEAVPAYTPLIRLCGVSLLFTEAPQFGVNLGQETAVSI